MESLDCLGSDVSPDRKDEKFPARGCPKSLCRSQQFSETPGKAEGSQMGTGSTLRKEGEGSDRYRS